MPSFKYSKDKITPFINHAIFSLSSLLSSFLSLGERQAILCSISLFSFFDENLDLNGVGAVVDVTAVLTADLTIINLVDLLVVDLALFKLPHLLTFLCFIFFLPETTVNSSDGQFALSGSCDGDLRLWDLATGDTTRRFVGHTKDVLSVAFSIDNRQIVSASRDRTIKLWNTLGECKYTISGEGDGHKEWVSCVRFSPNTLVPTVVSASWDHSVKVWNLQNCKLRNTLGGHNGYLNTVAVSPDGSLCASGGKDGVILLWDLAEGKKLYSLEAGSVIHSLCFSPNRYWLCAATENSIRIWDLESKTVVEDLKVDLKAEVENSDASVGTGNKKKVI